MHPITPSYTETSFCLQSQEERPTDPLKCSITSSMIIALQWLIISLAQIKMKSFVRKTNFDDQLRYNTLQSAGQRFKGGSDYAMEKGNQPEVFYS